MKVFGAIYDERVEFPYRDRLGNAARAATWLSSIGIDVELVALAEPVHKKQCELQLPGVSLSLLLASGLSRFVYDYELAAAKVFPSKASQVAIEGEFETENALVFGTREGLPRIRAKRVVFDPQNGPFSKLFGADGSTASEVYYSLNDEELRQVGGSNDIRIAANSLLQGGAKGVVVRLGMLGYMVFDSGEPIYVEPTTTTATHKVGAGGIFASALSHAIFDLAYDLVRAVKFGSVAVAEYQYDASEGISSTRCEMLKKKALDVKVGHNPPDLSQPIVRISAPFLTTAQRWIVGEMGRHLRKYVHQVISPPNDWVKLGDEVSLTIALVDAKSFDAVLGISAEAYADRKVIFLSEDDMLSSSEKDKLVEKSAIVVRDVCSAVHAAVWTLMGLSRGE